jgi:hypothetical protein
VRRRERKPSGASPIAIANGASSTVRRINARTEETMTIDEVISREAKLAAEGVGDLAKLAIAQDWPAFAKRAIELGVDLVPPETLRAHLTAEAIAVVQEADRIALDAKFGPRR